MARKRNLKVSFDDAMIKKFGLRDIRPIKNNGGINGVGNVSCCGFIGKKKVKIFTTYRSDMPELREKLEKVKFKGKVRFPPLIGTYKDFVIEEWINGPNLTQIPKPNVIKLVPAMVDFLFEFKEVVIPDYDSTYDHLECFASSVEKRNTHNALVSIWRKEREKMGDIPKHLRHGDLHEGNIILKNGTMYIIDNDGISLDNGWFLSWRKSFLYSTRFPPFPFKDPEKKTELKYYDGKVSFKFMQLTHFLRQTFFKRDLIDINNRKVNQREIIKRFGNG